LILVYSFEAGGTRSIDFAILPGPIIIHIRCSFDAQNSRTLTTTAKKPPT
jgi:hypothetical protein